MPHTHFRTVTRVATAFWALVALLAALIVSMPTARAAEVTDGLMLKYDLTQSSGTTVTDSSGNGKDGVVSGGAAAAAISIPGIDDVRGNITLPESGSYGSTIAWASDADHRSRGRRQPSGP